MTDPLPRIAHSKPSVPAPNEWAAVTDQLTPGWIADGPCVERFAASAAGWLGQERGVAVNSGTNALHLALIAVGVRAGDDVLVPAYCCAALLCAVEMARAHPVLVDCPLDGFNLCPEDALRRRTPKTRAVVVASLFGYPVDVASFRSLGLPIIEDCAQSFGARRNGIPSGGCGDVAIGSFYATKVVSTGQGGIVAGSNRVVAEAEDRLEYDQREDWQPRFNYRQSELPAALGLWQLERLPAYLQRRHAIAAHYDSVLSPTIAERPCEVGVDPIAFRYTLRVPDADEAFDLLKDQGVDAKRPVHRPLHHYLGGSFPGAEAAHQQIVSLPIYPSLTDSEVERVVHAASRLTRIDASQSGSAKARLLRD